MTSGLTKIDCTLCENIFGRYCVPKSSQHRPASQAALRGEVWELETINFIQRHTGDGDVIHAGMFFGDFLPGLASAVVSDRKVYGFEPNIENYIAAQWTAVLNALSNVQLFNAGLGAERKRAFMRTTSEESKALGGASYIIDYSGPRNGDGVSSISLVTIDELVPSTADVGIIQLDVEGYEASALRGGIQTIRRCLPIIIVETVPTAFVEEYLTPLGYSCTGTVCSNSIFTA